MGVVARRTELGPQRAAGLHRIVGTRFEVVSQIVEARASGRLRSKTQPSPVPGAPGVVEAYMVLSKPPGKTVPRIVAAVAGTAVVVAALVVWWVLTHLAVIGAVLAGAGVLVGFIAVVTVLLSDGCEITVFHRRR